MAENTYQSLANKKPLKNLQSNYMYVHYREKYHDGS